METVDWLLTGSERDQQSRGISSAQLKQLATRSDSQGLARLAIHVSALLVTGIFVTLAQSGIAFVVATLCHGFVLAFLFCAQHESAHRTAFASKKLNDALGQAVGFLLFLPHHAFRAFHWDHHRYAQDKNHDPELASPLPSSIGGLLWLWFGVPNWLNRARNLVNHGIAGRVSEPWIPQKQHRLIVNESRLYLLGYLGLAGLSVGLKTTLLIWLWILPVFCGYWFLRPYLLSEHTGCPNNGDRINRTRTTFTNQFVRLFAWNMPFHTEHHAYPAVPFHALPALHNRISTQLVNTESGYVTSWRKIVRRQLQQRKPQ